MTCEVENCRKPRHGARWCSMHATRWYAWGDMLGDTPELPKLSSGPLVQLVERRGGRRAVTDNDRDRRNYTRAKEKGVITVWLADELAHRLLDMHPAEVWGEAWWISTDHGSGSTPIDPQAHCAMVP